MNRIPLDLLAALLAFHESRNVLEAACALGLTQPALSKQLQRLERLLPAPVFAQSGRKKVLTPFGRELCERIAPRLREVPALLEAAWLRQADVEQARVRMVGRREILDRVAPTLDFPGKLLFEARSHEHAIADLLHFRAEIALTHRAPDTHELVARSLFRERFCVAVPKALVKKMQGVRALLSHLPALAYKEEDEILLAASVHWKMNGLFVTRVTENYRSLAAMVAAGRGWAVLPASMVPEKCWVWDMPAEALPKREFFLVYRKETLTPWMRELHEAIQRAFR